MNGEQQRLAAHTGALGDTDVGHGAEVPELAAEPLLEGARQLLGIAFRGQGHGQAGFT